MIRISVPLLAAGCLALAGCALLGKNEPQERRYFTPESAEPGGGLAQVPANRPARADGVRLRLGRVSAWSHLRERMVTRTSARELTYSDGRRWTERPDIYLQRALAHALFEERGLTQVISGSAPTLEVELIAFEETLNPRRALLQASIVLHDEHKSVLQETITVEELVEVKDADQAVAVVEALSRALQIAVTRISDHVVGKLAALPAGG
jgi:ABC-type uncharacterized transport system auxiliary subunit